MGAELFHADGRTDKQTDMTKLTGDFRNFANTPNNIQELLPGNITVYEYKSTHGAENGNKTMQSRRTCV